MKVFVLINSIIMPRNKMKMDTLSLKKAPHHHKKKCIIF